jgi:hypothetical protein
VAVGKWADLVLLNGNPLKDIKNTAQPAGVMISGRWLDRAELDSRLAALEGKLYDDPRFKNKAKTTVSPPQSSP